MNKNNFLINKKSADSVPDYDYTSTINFIGKIVEYENTDDDFYRVKISTEENDFEAFIQKDTFDIAKYYLKYNLDEELFLFSGIFCFNQIERIFDNRISISGIKIIITGCEKLKL